jgi:hypothetical protein
MGTACGEEELEEVVVVVKDVRESNGRLGRGQTRDDAGTVPAAEPNRPEVARVSRDRENRGVERGVSGGMMAVTGEDPRQQEAAAVPAGGSRSSRRRQAHRQTTPGEDER